ncbi:hypothetical protein [Streptomyces sp. DH10]|uniref:hypothetical protein n=1 Tax=Streptomyces sp. DH10 TaxID=3040121 RepID=UPI002442CCA8|nr:hypothetical protein [Streptomyces sp. DH10]MDG9712075.1 hypothetical protein [Streptomyces sp. DH10]
MTTRNTPANPQRGAGAPAPRRPEPAMPCQPGAPYEPAPAETDPFSSRARGRHRKPRPRKALLAAGGLALAAGALSLVRLTSGPGTDSVGSVEAEPRPDPVTTGTNEATHTAATGPAAPEASPSSPTALGGLPASPGTRGPAAASRTPSSTYTATSADTRGAHTTAAPRPAAVPDTTNPPAPSARDNDKAPRPARTPPSPPNRTAPSPAPEPEKQKEPEDPRLCVPVIGLCVDAPG